LKFSTHITNLVVLKVPVHVNQQTNQPTNLCKIPLSNYFLASPIHDFTQTAQMINNSA